MRIKVIGLSILITVLVFFAAIYFFSRSKAPNNETEVLIPDNTITSVPENADNESPTIIGGNYTVSSLVVRSSEKIELFENFEEKLSAADAKAKYACEHILSGGFYGEDNKHLGLLIKEGEVITEMKESDLFNGFYSINNNSKTSITLTEPLLANTRLAFQSGPMLLENGRALDLSVKNDENARRIIAALTPQNHTVFLAIYIKLSPLSGPKLSDLPKIIDELQEKTNLKFTNALNLDGGAHSAFIGGNTALNEIVRAGTFICIKP